MFAYCGNNPVNECDQSGCFPQDADVRYCDLDNINSGAGSGGGGELLLLSDILSGFGKGISDAISYFYTAIQVSVLTWAYTQTQITDYDNNSVYLLIDPNDGLVKYVGRTNNPPKRWNAHKRRDDFKNYQMVVVATGLSKPESMLLEQVLISAFTLQYLSNARREIAVGNIPNFQNNMGAVISLISGVNAADIEKLIGR